MSLPLPSFPGVTRRHVKVGDASLHLTEMGEGDPVMLLHGWPQHHWIWRNIAPELARTRRVLMPDLRGWGWSDAPNGLYEKATFARDMVGLLDALGVEQTDLIGHDWGGWTTFLLALNYPERVRRAIALDITPPWRPPLSAHHLRTPAFLSYQLAVAAPFLGPRTMTSSGAFVRALIRGGSGPDMRWSDEELNVYADVLREPARALASSRVYRTFLTREVPRAAAGGGLKADDLKVNTLLIMGGASLLQRTFRPQASRNLQVEILPRVGHFIPEEAPQAVLERAQSFLRP